MSIILAFMILLWSAISSAQPVILPPPAAAGSGDITDVFSCSTGDCSSITMGSDDFLDMSGATPSNTAGLKLSDATDCSAATGEGVVCWDSNDDQLYIGDGAASNAVGGGTGDVTDVFDCASGNCSSITMDSGDFLDMSGAIPANTSGLKLPDATSCASVTGEGIVCWDSDNDQLWIGDGATPLQVGGGITDVFACGSGNCSSITMDSGDFLDMSGATPSDTSGLKLPDATSCAAVTGEGVICWDSDDDQLVIGNGSSRVTIGVGTGDVTDVFACSSGDCASITMGASDFLDMSGATPSNTSGLKLPDATDCSAATDEGVVCWDSDDNQIVVGDGSTVQTFTTNTGDVTDVFGCSSGDCSSITMGASDFLDLSGATPTNTAGLKLPDATDCAAATGEGVLCWDNDDDNLVIGNGSTTTTIGASSSLTLDQAFDNGKVIDGANSQANGARIGDGTDYWGFYIGASG